MAPKWQETPLGWKRSQDYFHNAPWRNPNNNLDDEEQLRVQRAWQGNVGWMGRAAERLDQQASAGEPAADRSAGVEEDKVELQRERLTDRLQAHLAVGFNPGRHVWYVKGRPTVVSRRSNTEPLSQSLPPVWGGA